MRRLITLLACGALVASGLSMVPASAAEEAPVVPDQVQIEDVVNDANYLNDQGVGNGVDNDDNATPADVGSFSDILKVWFTNDAETVTAHIQTQAFPGANRASIYYIVYASPGEGSAASSTLGCLRFVGILSGATYAQSADEAKIFDHCNEGSSYFSNGAEAKFSMVEGPDGTGIVSITAPRAYSELLNAATLTAPYAETRNITGEASAVGFLSGPRIDTTKVGIDFVMASGEAGKTPPGKNDPPGKKKGCTKGKGKKRGCEGKGKKAPKPGKPSAQCAPFTPGEAGKDKPTVVLTDEATEEKPVEQTVSMGPSLADLSFGLTAAGPFAVTGDTFNIVVDSKNKDAGLYALLEFAPRRDYDLNLLHPDGSFAAQSRSFNTGLETPFSQPGHGGEGTDRSEKLVGIKTNDCGGWTLAAENHLGEGGDLTVKLWLGAPQIDPLEEGAETP